MLPHDLNYGAKYNYFCMTFFLIMFMVIQNIFYDHLLYLELYEIMLELMIYAKYVWAAEF